LNRDAAVRRARRRPLASFSSIRALEGEHNRRASEGYKIMFRRVARPFESPELEALDKDSRSIRALVLLEQLYWASAWLGDYDLDDYPRLIARVTDIVSDGLAPPGVRFEPAQLALKAPAQGAEQAKENFLLAATREINKHGYRGASVDRISASLNLTKGAFYHHNEAKDDLVAACFRRSFGIIRQAQREVRGQGPNEWTGWSPR